MGEAAGRDGGKKGGGRKGGGKQGRTREVARRMATRTAAGRLARMARMVELTVMDSRALDNKKEACL